MEFERFTFEDIQYVVGAEIMEFDTNKVPCPYISVTTKSSRKNRKDKLTDKMDEHFNRIPIKNVIGFYKKVYSIFENNLLGYNHVIFSVHKDSEEKRIKIYTSSLEKMGFNLVYVYVCPWDKSFKEYLMIRNGNIPKKKDIVKMFENAYGV